MMAIYQLQNVLLQNQVKSNQNSPVVKKVSSPYCDKKCEIQDSGQELAVIVG